MDALAGLLDGPRARDAFLLRMVMEPPWSVRIEDRAPICLMALTAGEAWIVPNEGDTVHLAPGDVAVVRGPAPYTVTHTPGLAPFARIGPGGSCTTLRGEALSNSMDLGVRTWGNAPNGSATMLVGTYLVEGEISGQLLDALPPVLLLTAQEWNCALMPLLDEEIARDEPGQSVVLDRLLDLLLIAVLRSWFSRPGAHAPAWYRAMGDPVVGAALRLMQNSPAHPWTVASLAAKCGMSRAGFSRRFAELVGESPMAHLTVWRLALAADRLRETDATVETIAHQVGYSGAFALSAAFKRVRGISPQEHRTRGRNRAVGVGPADGEGC
ncbi:cupin domain-containing protein [Streptomyces sp. NPDC056084]|uniref:AraC family transcriptional regulator n=1 Tax=unclassified Streptomyces TaxID=2593676 RepID=UPI0035E12D97